MMAIGIVIAAWAVLAAVVLIGWVRLRDVDHRAESIIDEMLYASDPGDTSRSEAA